MKILYVEDEVNLSEAVSYVMKKYNYDVDVCYDGEEGLCNALSGIYDVIVLDVMLPSKDGITILKELRTEGVNTPIIMLTALSEIEDKLLGFDSGADDYLCKPFDTMELIARVKSLSRRKDKVYSDNISFLDISLDLEILKCSCGNNEFKLTLKEGLLLELLINNSEKVISKDLIIEKLWGYDSDVIDNNVEVYISFLRKKLSALGSKVCIKTVRNLGYVLSS